MNGGLSEIDTKSLRSKSLKFFTWLQELPASAQGNAGSKISMAKTRSLVTTVSSTE
jgi:hypothetical protein